MKRTVTAILCAGTIAAAALALMAFNASESVRSDSGLKSSMKKGKAAPESLSVLTFADDGTLFIGDSKGGAVYAVEVAGETKKPAVVVVKDIEARIAERLGTKAEEILVHDMAVHPISKIVFLAVSRGRTNWNDEWQLPNHVANADILLTVDGEGAIAEFSLDDVRFAKAELSNPIDPKKTHSFMEDLSLRTDTITDIAYTRDTLFVAGLSNEEFASTMWRIPLPFSNETKATTLEVFHGAHGEYETHAPIRTFVPYDINGEEHILAAYLCTPFALFKVKDLENKDHVRGRTIAEFGAGNYPLDMVVAPGAEGQRLLIANSNLPLMSIYTKDIASYKGEITERPDSYTAGLGYVGYSGTGIQQLEFAGENVVLTLKRMPSGTLDLGGMQLRTS